MANNDWKERKECLDNFEAILKKNCGRISLGGLTDFISQLKLR